MLELNADITDLKGADYNPREITESDLEALRESVRRLGIVKPIIARNQTIVAGHQRMKSLLRMGITTAPVYRLSKDANQFDEVRFNQLHNGTDLDYGDEDVQIHVQLQPGHNVVQAEDVTANFRGIGAPVRSAIASLIRSYGPWGACVATPDGRVIHAAQYALACVLCDKPLDVFVVREEDVEFATNMLARQYGVFSYKNIERKTYIQALAQPPRMLEEDGTPSLGRLYVQRVEPWLQENPGSRALDFGAGRGRCALKMREAGHDILDLEFFRQSRGEMGINKTAVHRMIAKVAASVKKNGLFDFAVCQAVLNSVDTMEAEQAVLGCLNMFLKMNGRLVISGRSLEELQTNMANRKASDQARRPEFLDENNFTALFRAGTWFFQKYHSIEVARATVEKYGFKILEATANTVVGGYWVVVAEKERELSKEEYRQAVDFEFELPWPDGTTVGRSHVIRELFNLG